MDTKLYGGGFATGHTGLPVQITGKEEIAQQAYIRLAVRRGSFPPDPELGSELYKLPRGTPQVLIPLATAYIQEALCTMPQIGIVSVDCLYNSSDDSINVQVTLQIKEQQYSMEVVV